LGATIDGLPKKCQDWVGRQLDPISVSIEGRDCITSGYRSGLTNLISLEEFSKFKESLSEPEECTSLVGSSGSKMLGRQSHR
jgi:hypothetical protein